MIVELGHLALSVALAASVALAVLGLGGAARHDAAWMRFAPRLVVVQAATVTLAFAALTWAFVHTDFSVALVAGYAHSALPLVYRYTAVWGNHEGSMLLWVWVLAGWTLAVAWRTRSACAVQRARVLGVMGLIGVGFLAFLLFTSNPFLRAWPVPADGQGMNPLLQDPGMVWHPPLLYMGYVGLVVAFAYTVAGLLQGELGSAWARAIRPWTLVAWAFLTVGIALGSFWAYYELGWGGWWFWDPVENASFMPWLVATALLHSAAMADARGSFRLWTALLALLGFALALLGTFIVRSGVCSARCTRSPQTPGAVCLFWFFWRWWWAVRLRFTLGVRPQWAWGRAFKAGRARVCCLAKPCCSWWPRPVCCWARYTPCCLMPWGSVSCRWGRRTLKPCLCP